MLQYLLFYFFIFPITEYFIHLLLHKTNNYIHKKHHIKYHTNTFSIEKTPLLLATLLIYNQYYQSANCFLIYWIIHTTIHLKPHLVPTLYTHHHLHHKYNNCNYAVSTTWPDYLFRTIKK
jgi:sterol desaturase/sphingolipid hydroxylase (fatty acid hydroxylase superfamily)